MARIVYIGNYRHSFCTEVHIARDLESLGHQVDRFQEPPGGAGGTVFLREVEAHCVAEKPDVLLFTRTWGLPRQCTRMWRRLEARGMRTASYHLDLYVGLHRQRGVRTDPFWTTQHVFTPDGDQGSAEWFRRAGINHHWSPAGVVSDECEPGAWRDEYDYDVVFVGSRGYHNEWPWRQTLLDHVEQRYGQRFRRFGGDTAEGPTRGADLNDLYATARVVIGDSLCLPGHRNYWSDRPYETVGRGGYLIMPKVPGLEQHFTGGEHLDWYDLGDIGSVDRAIDSALDHPTRGQAIARKGQAHVREHHTYRHRLAKALQTMGVE